MRRALLLLPLPLIAGCRDGQSALTPYGTQAAEIAQLSWVLFLGGALVLIIVVVATAIAIRGPAALRRTLATPRMVVAGGIVFPAVVLVALLFFNIALMQSSALAPSSGPATNIAVAGEQWWWRVTYQTPTGAPVPGANEIRIPVGRDVLFTLSSADVIHSFWVPSLGGKVDMIPGRQTRLRIHATRPGVFRGPCAEYCGGPHALMALQVTALPAGEFDAWLGREAGNAASPETGRLFSLPTSYYSIYNN
jgi:cytochrome c oxidase subunit 2